MRARMKLFSHRCPNRVSLSLLGCGHFLAATTFSEFAAAGNLDAFYMSGEAALQAGAVVATTETGGSIWYNPAGLAALKGTRLDVNVSGYTARFGAEAHFESTLPRADVTPLSLLNIDVVPAAVTLTRQWGEVGIGLGVFVPSQSGTDFRTYLDVPPDATGTSMEFGYDSASSYQEYHAGPGVGWNPFEQLSLGASLLANYRTQSERTDRSATIVTPDGQQSRTQHHSLNSQGVGLEMVIGAQWQIAEAWRIGAVMRTPAFRLGQVAHRVDTDLQANSAGEIIESSNFQEEFGLDAQILSPFRFHLGLAYDIDRWSISAEGSLLTAFNNEAFGLKERTTWNLRAGAKYELNEFWTVGGGLFTDRSPIHEATEFQQARLDYYGTTLAIDWRRTFGIFSKNGEALDEPTSLFFGTTISFSYALGVGEVVGAQVGPGSDGDVLWIDTVSSVTAHELTLHIASTFGQ
jgi:long-subunit fatty acid transport protein